MELVNALLIAGPVGWFVRDRRRSLLIWLGIWAAILPVQSWVVATYDDNGLDPATGPSTASS